MSITRTLFTTLALLPLVTACQVYTGKPEGPPPATRLQGQVLRQNAQLLFVPCQEQRRFVLRDTASTGIERESAIRLAQGRPQLFADLAGQLAGSQEQGSDGRFEVSRLYRLQNDGRGCEDPNFKRLILRAAGNEPAWQVEVSGKGLVLNRAGEQPLALPYLEEQLPEERLSFSSEANGQRLELWVAPQRCEDANGTLSPLTAELRLDGQIMRGCAHYGGARN